MANNTPAVKLIDTDHVEVMTLSAGSTDVFYAAGVSKAKDKFLFRTKMKVNAVQIFNAAGQLEFQFPVNSKKVSISKSLFENGKNQLGFVMVDSPDVFMTSVTIK